MKRTSTKVKHLPEDDEPDEHDMAMIGRAIVSAEMSSVYGDYPIGAVLSDGVRVHHGFNRVQTTPSPLAHAECDAIRTLTEELRTKYLDGWTMYSTVQPCAMCMTAAYWAGIRRVVWGLGQEELHLFGRQYGDKLFKFRPCPILGNFQLRTLVRRNLEALGMELVGGVGYEEVLTMMVKFIKDNKKHAEKTRRA